MANRMRNKLATAREQVKEAYENGATLRQIGEVHGVSAGTVRNVLREMGVELRPRGRRKLSETPDDRALQLDAPAEPEQPASYEGGSF